jgi:tRNA (adenine22-N1)-methyltransferase
MKKQESHAGPVSLRLETVAAFVPDGARVADIGADHALLLIHLARAGRIRRGIAGELNRGPYLNAIHRVRQAGLDHLIEVRQGDGLSVLAPGEVDVIVLAGMGGTLMADILQAGIGKLEGVHRLVLQPNIGGKRVRRWLKEHGFYIVDETIVEEEGILYEVAVAEPGDWKEEADAPWPEEMMMEIGPVLWRKRHPLLKRKLLVELESREAALAQLRQARTEEAKRRRASLEEEREQWKKVIACL